MQNSILGQILNRIGIIFNFVAGFLIAPEKLGQERIRKYESKLELAAISGSKNIDGLIGNNLFVILMNLSI